MKNKKLIYIFLIIILLLVGLILFVYFYFYKNISVVNVTGNNNINQSVGQPEKKLNKLQEYCNVNDLNKKLKICELENNKIIYDLIPEEYANNLFQNTLNKEAADKLFGEIAGLTKNLADQNYIKNTSHEDIDMEVANLMDKSYSFVKADGDFDANLYNEYVKLRQDLKDIYNKNLNIKIPPLKYNNNLDYYTLSAYYLKNLFSCIGQNDVKNLNTNIKIESRVRIADANQWCNNQGKDFLKEKFSKYFSIYELLNEYQLLPGTSGINQDAFVYLCNEEANDNRALSAQNTDLESGRTYSTLMEAAIKNDLNICEEQFQKETFYYGYCVTIVKSLNGNSTQVDMSLINDYVNNKMDLDRIVEQLIWGNISGIADHLTYRDLQSIKDDFKKNPTKAKEQYVEMAKNNIIIHWAIFKKDQNKCELINSDNLRKAACLSALTNVSLENNWCYQELLKFANKFNEKY